MITMLAGRRSFLAVGFLLLPIAALLRELAFQFPHYTELVYGQRVYPHIALALGKLNNMVPFSLAEALAGALFLCPVLWLLFRKRRHRRKGRLRVVAFLLRAVASLWILAGLAACTFLLLWGLNYARPSLESRLGLPVEGIQAEEVLEAGKVCAETASSLHAALDMPAEHPTQLPMDFPTLNQVIDQRLQELALPGDSIRHPTSPAKKLVLSPAISYLGVSGIFVPFTGEPSTNGLIPDASIPLVVAHEKAHQRGITNEGEANLVAFLACSGAEKDPYLRYTAYLFATAELIGAASAYLPEEASAAWELLGPGPRQDLIAIREFWSRYEGPLTEVADKLNDTYLRSLRVPEGVQSYRRVTRLLVALDRQGKLLDGLE